MFFFKFCLRPGGSFIYCPLITSLTYKRVQFNNISHTCSIVLEITENEKVDVLNGDFTCRHWDWNLQPSDQVNLCHCHGIITAWPPIGSLSPPGTGFGHYFVICEQLQAKLCSVKNCFAKCESCKSRQRRGAHHFKSDRRWCA